jgi:hypothetical protein
VKLDSALRAASLRMAQRLHVLSWFGRMTRPGLQVRCTSFTNAVGRL